jgi:uncharacterized membrane protein (DUF4010 family)
MEMILARVAAFVTLGGIILLVCDLFLLRVWVLPLAAVLILAFPIFFHLSGWQDRLKKPPEP